MPAPTPIAAMPDVSALTRASADDWMRAQEQWFGQVFALQQAWAAAWWNWQLGWMQPMADSGAWLPQWTRWYNGSEQLA